jgi:hypothetical protein
MIETNNKEGLEAVESVVVGRGGATFAHEFEPGYDYFIGPIQADEVAIRVNPASDYTWLPHDR